MTTDEDFAQIFSDTDVLVVVDEWKGKRTQSEPEYLVARSFDATTLPLYRTLVAHGAGTWHASGTRGEHEFLFSPSIYPSTIRQIEQTGTCLYDHLFRDVAEYSDGTAAAANWRQIMGRDKKGLGAIWKVKSSRHARALFWFVELVLRCLVPRSTAGSRVHVILDRQDWFSGRQSHVTGEGLSHVGGRRDSIVADIFSITNKSHESVAPYLPFLGLVDSEAWALGRILSLNSPNGMRVHDLGMQWMQSGQPDSIRNEIDALFESLRARYPELGAYLELQHSWGPEKAVELNEGLAALDVNPAHGS